MRDLLKRTVDIEALLDDPQVLVRRLVTSVFFEPLPGSGRPGGLMARRRPLRPPVRPPVLQDPPAGDE